MSTEKHERLDRFVEEAVEAEFETGRREETVEQAKAHLLVRLARISAGTVLLLAGVIMIFMPGPGLVGIALGLILLSYDVPFAARLLEKIRHRLPHDENGDLQVPKGMLALSIGLLVVSVSGGLYWQFIYK